MGSSPRGVLGTLIFVSIPGVISVCFLLLLFVLLLCVAVVSGSILFYASCKYIFLPSFIALGNDVKQQPIFS